MTNNEKLKSAGKAMYMLGMSGVEIARTIDVSENTISTWVKKEGWREERAIGMAQKETIQDTILFLIEYQLEALRQQVEKNRANGNDLPLLSSSHVDGLAKLFAQIKGKELTFATLVTIIRELIEFLNQKSPDLAKALIPHTNDFLLAKKEVLTA